MSGTHLLPQNLLKLFAPRPPLPYKRPVGKDIDRVRSKNVSGVGEILDRLKQEAAAHINGNGEGMEEGEEPAFTLAEEVKRQIRREERKKRKQEEFKVAKDTYKPADDAQAIGDPYKTLFISRLHKGATENDLRREFESFGTIERVRIVRDKKGRSRGYAFIVYERERDMKAAYKESDGLHIMGKRILVDVERGRTEGGRSLWRVDQHLLPKLGVEDSEAGVDSVTAADSEVEGVEDSEAEGLVTAGGSGEAEGDIAADARTDTGKCEDVPEGQKKLLIIHAGAAVVEELGIKEALETDMPMDMVPQEVVQVGMVALRIRGTVRLVVGTTVVTSNAKDPVGMTTEMPSDRGTSCGWLDMG
ncbi:hypothetical protein ID866_2729, partial [Astraeus odoratus]